MKTLNLFFLFAVISLILSGCMGTELLGDKEYLLRNQKIKGTQKINKQELAELYRQETNRRIFFFPALPYVYIYDIGLSQYDPEKIRKKREKVAAKFNRKIAEEDNENRIRKLSKKKNKKLEKIDTKLQEGNMFMRWGEPPTILDSSLTQATAEQMALYMQTKGFLQAAATYQIKYINKTAIVSYQIKEGPPYLIDTVYYRSTDPNINKLLAENVNDSHLNQGQRYDQEDMTRERERLYNLMRNNGYYTFDRQYVNFRVYDTLAKERLAIEALINNPRSGSHQLFRVDSVVFKTEEERTPRARETPRVYSDLNGVAYGFHTRRFSEKILSQRIFIEPDSLYSQEKTIETQRQLANLDNFRSINIFYDSAGGNFTANIYASPLKKYQTSNEVGLGFVVSEGFPSPFYNFSLKNRNVFGGLENMELNARASLEGIPSASDPNIIYRSVELGGNFALTFPQFALPLGPRLKRRLGSINPRTKVMAGATFSNRKEYVRTTFNSSMTYSWQKGLNRFLDFTFIDLNLINTRFSNDPLSQDFKRRLEEFEAAGNNLINSFNPSFVNSMALSITYNFNDYGFNPRKASLLKLFFENGGTFLHLTGTDFLGDLQHYKFFKASIDYRRYRPIERTTTLAMRGFFGIAIPYGETDALPYEKYFFAGGSSGMRAWRPRRLGPGSFADIDTLENGRAVYDNSFEQQAEILLEANIELRRKLIGFLEGALFIDAGNSWMIKEDRSRPGANFELDRFYKEIAVGAGFGARLDFSFLIIRFDWGFKIYDPARAPGSRFVFDKTFNDGPFENAENYTLNLGIGYPF